MNVTAREYEFGHRQAGGPVQQGRIAFLFENQGRLYHELTLIIVPRDMQGTIDRQARSGEERRAFVNVFSFPARPPGGKGAFAVDLEPGRYAMVCLLEDEDGRLHAAKGMASEFKVA